MAKRCSYCRKSKSSSCFYKNRSKPDGLQNICSECAKHFSGEYYQRNKEKHKSKVKKWRTAKNRVMKAHATLYLNEHPCVDCGEHDIEVLDFDHVDEKKKSYMISKMIKTGFSWNKILKEIKKCQVRCANCHRKRSYKQFGWNT